MFYLNQSFGIKLGKLNKRKKEKKKKKEKENKERNTERNTIILTTERFINNERI